MLLCLGIWAGSAFADGAVTAVTNAVTDTIPTDTTATSPNTDTTATTDTTSTSGGGVTTTTPVDTVTTPVATTSPPVAITVGPDQATASDPGTGANAVAPATASQTAAAAAATAAAKSANAKGAHKAKKRRDPSPRAAPVGSRPVRPAGGIVPRTHHASAHTKTTKTTKATKTTTTANAKRATVKAVHLTTKAKTPATTPTAHANGGRDDAASNEQAPVSPAQPPVSIAHSRPSHHQDGGIGFDTPQGHLSISPTGFKLGGSERSIASVDGVLTAVLDTLAVLAALAAVIGAGALLSKIRRNRRESRRRVRIAAARPRTREQLYVEAKRQNVPGRSKMTKAQLERALYPPPPVRERHVKRVSRFEALRGLRVPLPRGGSRGNGH